MNTPSGKAAALAALLAAAAVAAHADSGQVSGPQQQTPGRSYSAPWQRPGYPPLRPWYPSIAPYQHIYGLRPPGYGAPAYWPHDRAAVIETGPPDIIATLEESGEFSSFLQTLDRARLTALLRGKGPFTVLAPSDDAFDALPDGVLETLIEDGERLKAVLEFCIVEGSLTAADLLVAGEVETISGHEREIDDLHVRHPDVHAGNGVIHVVDEIVAPPLF